METRLCPDALRRAAAEFGDKTYDDISARTGIAYATVHRMLNGGSPLLSTVARFALAYGVPISDLMAKPSLVDGAA